MVTEDLTGQAMAKQKVLPFPDSGIYASLQRATPYERGFSRGSVMNLSFP